MYTHLRGRAQDTYDTIRIWSRKWPNLSSGGGVVKLVADPTLAVMLDMLLEAGHVRSIEIWTDEEAERCRLVAFDLAQAKLYEGTAWQWEGRWLRADDTGGARMWCRESRIFSTERWFGAFDPPDWALDAPKVAP